MLKLTLLIFVICKCMTSALAATPLSYCYFTVAQEVYGCQIEFKELDNEKIIVCSSMMLTGITWIFNNQSELSPGIVVSQDGNSITIPPSNISVYGNYSCSQNNMLVNCISLYLEGMHVYVYRCAVHACMPCMCI